ncbi:hypothetical protein Gotri_024948, partial [Gossypium trilobum]|nr:hypothetical protein [Gossypium trilobum]
FSGLEALFLTPLNTGLLHHPDDGRVKHQHININYSKVTDLINKDSFSWNYEAIWNLLERDQAEAVLSIPLVSRTQLDVLIWRGNKSGEYAAGCSNMAREQIRRIHSPSKIKRHLWRVVNNFLLTLSTLKLRRLRNDVAYPIYSVEEETVEHLFQDYGFKKQPYQFLFGQYGIIEIEFTTKEKIKRVQEVANFIRAYLRELEQVNSSTETRINPREVFWRPLKEEQVKANFEAAFLQQDMTATAGVIIRNHEGFVMGACTYPLGRTGDLTTAEANVYLQAAIFGEEMGFRDLVFEGDALIVIKKLKSDSVDRSVIGNIINEI